MPRRATADLIPITIRLRSTDIQAARLVAGATATRYQTVIRAWVVEGARRAKRKKHG